MTSIIEIRVSGRFRLEQKYDKGTFSEIYEGRHMHSKKRIIAKLEEKKSKFPQVAFESQILRRLQGKHGIPELYWSGSDGDFNCLILQKLGLNLAAMSKRCGGSLSLKTGLILLDQMINLLESLHDNNIIHRDVKPENFCMGAPETDPETLYLIDFGLSKIYYTEESGHIEKKGGKSLLGQTMFASISNLQGFEMSRKDDLESMIYTFLFLTTGSLPWQNSSKNLTMNKILKRKIVLEVKSKFDSSRFWETARVNIHHQSEVVMNWKSTGGPNLIKIPPTILEMYKDIRKIGFSTRPSYDKYRKMVKKLMLDLNMIQKSDTQLDSLLLDWELNHYGTEVDACLSELDQLINADYEFDEKEDEVVDALIRDYELDGVRICYDFKPIRKQNKKYVIDAKDDESAVPAEGVGQKGGGGGGVGGDGVGQGERYGGGGREGGREGGGDGRVEDVTSARGGKKGKDCVLI